MSWDAMLHFNHHAYVSGLAQSWNWDLSNPKSALQLVHIEKTQWVFQKQFSHQFWFLRVLKRLLFEPRK